MSEPLSIAQMLSSLSHAVGEGPGVEALADLADEIALGGEFEELGCGRRIGRTAGAVRAREHEDVALGVHGHSGHLAKIHAVRQLREIRHGIEGDLRNALLGKILLSKALLNKTRRCHQHQARDYQRFHGNSSLFSFRARGFAFYLITAVTH
jgi:hypothetical protein